MEKAHDVTPLYPSLKADGVYVSRFFFVKEKVGYFTGFYRHESCKKTSVKAICGFSYTLAMVPDAPDLRQEKSIFSILLNNINHICNYYVLKTTMVWELLNGKEAVAVVALRGQGIACRTCFTWLRRIVRASKKCLTWVYGDASHYRENGGALCPERG
jgi:hypothetical protein